MFAGHCVRGLLFPLIQTRNMGNKNTKLSYSKNATKAFTFINDSMIAAEYAHLSRSLNHVCYDLVIEDHILK